MEVPDLREGYVHLCQQVLARGRKREARGYVAYDVADASFTVTDARKLLPYGTGRKVNADIALGEALLLCGGLASPSLLVGASPAFRRFLDGGVLAGAYGPLIRPQMDAVVRSLVTDPDTRQAVVRVHPGAHEVVGLRDVPCTLGFGFELRDDGLHMRAVMRSNDVFLGLTYDAFMFGQLGWTVANLLGVELVTYTHFAYSLHAYERNLEEIEALSAPGTRIPDDGPTGFGSVPCAGTYRDYEPARARAEQVYDGNLKDPTSSEEWYLEQLSGVYRLTRTANFAS